MIPAFSQVCVLTLILWSLCVCECNCVGIFPIHTFHPIPPTISPPFPPSPLWHAIFLTDNPSWPVLGQCVCVGIVSSLSTHLKLLKTTSYTYPAKAFSKRELFLKTNSKIEGFGIFLKIESSSPSGPIIGNTCAILYNLCCHWKGNDTFWLFDTQTNPHSHNTHSK